MRFGFIMMFLFFSQSNFAQQDSILPATASLKKTLLQYEILSKHSYFNFADKAAPILISKKERKAGKELYFYSLVAIVLLFAGVKTVFDKYFSDLLSLFFRTTLKQRQLRQQLMQDALPSLLFNILYIVVTAFYLALLLQRLGVDKYSFGVIFCYAMLGMGTIYLVKYLLLKFIGWMFHWQPITNEYIFIVFFLNKISIIFLLPIIVIAALSNMQLATIAFTLSWIILCGLLIYRYILASGIIRKAVTINFFHFVLYLFAFEILPVFVLYKLIWILLT